MSGLGVNAGCTSSPGMLECTLIFGLVRWAVPIDKSGNTATFTTRGYNGQLPGPHIKVSPGDRVKLHLVNDLEPSDAYDPMITTCETKEHSQYGAPNGTNLHIHGLFDGVFADNTFACVEGGQKKTYTYDIDPRTGSALHWIHPHVDGSSFMQLYGGAAGIFEIVDPKLEECSGLGQLPATNLIVQYMRFTDSNGALEDALSNSVIYGGANPKTARSMLPLNLESTTEVGGGDGAIPDAFLVNGQLAPTLSIASNGFGRVKIVNAVADASGVLSFGFTGAAKKTCKLHVLAYDGIFISGKPRLQRSALIPSGGKIEVMVSCSKPGKYTLQTVPVYLDNGKTEWMDLIPSGKELLHVDVSGPQTRPGLHEHPFMTNGLPGPPAYYTSLTGKKPDSKHHFKIMMSDEDGENVINNVKFGDEGSMPGYAMASTGAPNSPVQQWKIDGGEPSDPDKAANHMANNHHPYHQHFQHFQIMRVSNTLWDTPSGAVAGYHSASPAPGDWLDTIPTLPILNYTVAMVPRFRGLMMIHCHVLKHEDAGMMTLTDTTSTAVKTHDGPTCEQTHTKESLCTDESSKSIGRCDKSNEGEWCENSMKCVCGLRTYGRNILFSSSAEEECSCQPPAWTEASCAMY